MPGDVPRLRGSGEPERISGLRVTGGIVVVVADAGAEAADAGASDVRGGIVAPDGSALDGPRRPIVTCT